MRKLIEEISARLVSCVDQRDDAALVTRCTDADAITVLKCLESNDETSASELYWIHAEPFISPHHYVSDVVRNFAAKHEAISVAMNIKGMKPWPQIPAQIFDEALDPVQRLRQLILFSRLLLPRAEGCLSVWAFCPTQIADPRSHTALFYSLLQHSNPFPWFHRLRFFVREDLSAYLSLTLQQHRLTRTNYYAIDLSNAAIKQSLDTEASNSELPPNERIQALFLSAQGDFSERNFDLALEKQTHILRYHIHTGNGPMTALSLQSIGEIHQRLGREEQAGRCFEASFGVASEAEQPQLPILLNSLLSLANLRLGQNRLGEAEVYYENTEKLATVLRNPVTKLQSLENLGYCQYAQGKTEEAIKNWRNGAAIAEELEQPAVEANMLTRLRYHFFNLNQAHEMRAIDARLAALDQQAG
jgi:tetratricopeptide (TPR) repeat protein